MLLNSLRVQYPPTLSHQSYPLPPTQTKKKIRSASKLQIGLQVSSLLLFLLRGFCWWDILLPCVTQQFHEQHFKKKRGGWGRGETAPLPFSNPLSTTWWTWDNGIMPETDGKFIIITFWEDKIGSSIIWASRRQAIMDNGTQEYPYEKKQMTAR